jgi:hypothetical protein
LILVLLLQSMAYAQQTVSPTEITGWRAEIVEIKSTEFPGISFLSWDDTSVWVEENQDLQYTILKGHVSENVNQLNLNGKNVYVNDSGDFEIRFGFRGREKLFRITVLDPKNKVYRAQFRLASPSKELVKAPRETETLDFSLSRFRYSFGLGYTRIRYQQTNVDSFDEQALTLKGGILYRLVPNRWDLGASGFYNAMVIKSTSEFSVRYLGLNLRAGYHVIDAPSRFRFVLNGGFYLNNSYGQIGFANMYGPQLYPEFSYILRNGDSVMVYGKFSPALSQSSIDFKTNRELAAGIYYSFPLNYRHRMSLGIDYSKLDLSTDTDTANTSTLSFSASLSF